ncbi:MAG TPA: transposase [Sedimentisphaerales bacterium]|nr:transposase [Sedimentisphaerales bacterium]
MPRQARTVIAQCAHHVTQRGGNRQDVFFVDADRRAYLKYLRDAAARYALRVNGYCLMTNHVHLIVEPQEESSLAQALKRTNQLYAQYVNRMHRRHGHFWQDRFFSCPLDDVHLWRALAYVERNPVRARLCAKAWEWRWSSAAAHCGDTDPSGLLDLPVWRREMSPSEWRRILCESDEDELLTQVRLCTSRGRPLGSDAFIAKLETVLGRRLRAMPRGRPPRPSSNPANLEAAPQTEGIQP